MTDDYTLITERVIVGTPQKSGSEPADQLGKDKFLEALDELLNTPGVEKVKWAQYTPYFNDGDPCEFSTHEVMVSLSPNEFGNTSDGGDYGDGFLSSYEMYTIKDSSLWGKERYAESNRTWEINGASTADIYHALSKFEGLMGSFQTVAKDNFGDHCTVTADLIGFEIEERSHD